jgi:hypothetical protein
MGVHRVVGIRIGEPEGNAKLCEVVDGETR